jgi:hypothetical protein
MRMTLFIELIGNSTRLRSKRRRRKKKRRDYINDMIT